MRILKKVMVEVSARHVHLSQKDVEKLFGKGHELKLMRELSQPSDWAAKERVKINNKGREIKNVRVIGPLRKKSCLEISETDARFLRTPKLNVKIASDEKDYKILVIGQKGKVKVPVIIKQRHLHASVDEAKKLGLKNNERIKVKIKGRRALIFDNVVVRTHPAYRLAVHLDTDEGNAAGIDGEGEGQIIQFV
jgi:putative phosphotransacetylase